MLNYKNTYDNKQALILKETDCQPLRTATDDAATLLDSLTASGRQSALSSLEWLDSIFDSSAGLIKFAGEGIAGHLVRESAWYAMGLLLRHRVTDRERAFYILTKVVDLQYRDIRTQVYGSFPQRLEDPLPPLKPKRWVHYDPNWRQFISTAFVIILERFKKDLPADLAEKLRKSITTAIRGERQEGRIHIEATNIALMQAFLLDWTHDDHGKTLASAIYKNFLKHNAFPEYNSPTYYGVDLFALALWRTMSPSPELRQWGTDMEEKLWTDISMFYSPELGNMSGPFTRAYGMNMRAYVNLVGLELVSFLGDQAPFPDLHQPLVHAWDFAWAPVLQIVGTNIPDIALSRFKQFSGNHLIIKTIRDKPKTVTTAWISKTLLIGGFSASRSRRAGGQYHLATIHWRLPSGDVGWINLSESPKADAVAGKETLSIVSEKGVMKFVISATAVKLKADDKILKERWQLPGFIATIDTDAKMFDVCTVENDVEVLYSGVTRLAIKVLEHET